MYKIVNVNLIQKLCNIFCHNEGGKIKSYLENLRNFIHILRDKGFPNGWRILYPTDQYPHPYHISKFRHCKITFLGEEMTHALLNKLNFYRNILHGTHRFLFLQQMKMFFLYCKAQIDRDVSPGQYIQSISANLTQMSPLQMVRLCHLQYLPHSMIQKWKLEGLWGQYATLTQSPAEWEYGCLVVC